MSKLYKFIAAALLMSVAGFLFGILFIPPSVVLRAELLLIGFLLLAMLAAFILKLLKRDACMPLRFPMGIVYAVAFGEGIICYPIVIFYLQELGISLFITILVGTMLVFGALAVIGSRAKEDSLVSVWKTLGVVLGVMIIAFVVNLFIQSDVVGALLSAAGILVFCLFIVLDTFRFKKAYNEGYIHDRNDYSVFVLNIYLDIVNMLLDILDLAYRIKKNQ